jgi:formylglycine-generating enzyme required for sulfatase activity
MLGFHPRRALWAALLIVAPACGKATPAAETPTAAAPAPPAPAASSAPAPSAAPANEDAGAAPVSSNADSACPDDMAAIPGGTLWMGSVAGQGLADEHPQHQVEVQAFCLDLHEVTVADYQACVDNRICIKAHQHVQLLHPQRTKKFAKRSALCTAHDKSSADLPLTCVQQDEAAKFCEWKGKRLPTETEWEYAATGGSDKLDYPWGSAAPSDAVLCWHKTNGPCKVGAKPAGAFGLFDMEGNVSEWTSTYYAPYPNTSDEGTKVVVRGANWMTKRPSDVRPQARSSRLPLYRDVDLGFRCAKDQ